MKITLPPEIEEPLSEAARKQGTTTELLALESLRQLFPPRVEEPKALTTRTLYDDLADFIGIVEGTGEAFSENCGERFAEGLLKKHKAAGS